MSTSENNNQPKTTDCTIDAFRNTNHLHLLELIWTKAMLNLRSEVHRNYLSYLWWFIEPLMHMVMYYLVFGFLLQRGGPDFPVFLLIGLVPWMWFRKTLSSSSSSIIAGHKLMMQVGLPAISFPLVRVIQAAIKQVPIFFLLFGFLWVVGYPPQLIWFAVVPVMIVQALVATAMGCCIAAIIPFLRDLQYLVTTGLMFLMFVSGIFYSYKNIPEQYQEYFLMNPAAYLIMCYRKIFLESSLPDMIELSYWGIGAFVSCLLIVFAYSKLQYIYPRVILK